MKSERSPVELPGQYLPAKRLLHALQGKGSKRDERLIHLVLDHVDPGLTDLDAGELLVGRFQPGRVDPDGAASSR